MNKEGAAPSSERHQNMQQPEQPPRRAPACALQAAPPPGQPPHLVVPAPLADPAPQLPNIQLPLVEAGGLQAEAKWMVMCGGDGARHVAPGPASARNMAARH